MTSLMTQNVLHEPGLEDLLRRLSEDIDVPETKYEEAKEHYRAVGQWLGAPDSGLASFDMSIFAQGSFALGTAVKPTEGCDYDVDAVCLLRHPPTWSQERLKHEVGARLKAHRTYRAMLKPPEGGRRCWTLEYADGSMFHLDILPSKPDDYRWLLELAVPLKYASSAIQITSRDCYSDPVWPKSNPGGFLQWFVDRMRVRFDEARLRIAKSKRADIQAVPEYAVRTPLQRVVQLLKRQRDVMFGDDPDRPISIIITTLAARAYANEANLVTAYQNVVRGMRAHVHRYRDWYVILNPVNPLENFADRWLTHPERQTKFFEWLTAVEETERDLSQEILLEDRQNTLAKSFGPSGSRAAKAAREAFGVTVAQPLAEAVTLSDGLSSIMQAPHRAVPPWPMDAVYKATVSAKATRSGFRTLSFSDRSPSPPLSKGMDLNFILKTTVPTPFSVFWQVVNTGVEAISLGGLRGGFDAGKEKHRETTLYKGRHLIQAFVVKDGKCLARSKPVYVLIK